MLDAQDRTSVFSDLLLTNLFHLVRYWSSSLSFSTYLFSSIDRLMAFMPVFTAIQSLDILLDTSLQFPHCGLSWCWEFIKKEKDMLENGFWDSIWRRKLYRVLWSEANMG